MDAAGVARSLLAEAREANERRLLVLAGDRGQTDRAVETVLGSIDVGLADTTLVSDREFLACERVAPKRAAELLGTTRTAVVYDAHGALIPNAVGQLAGVVDGGGLFVLLAPPLEEWPERRDGFDEGLAVPPATVADVGGRFRRRFVETLRSHPGIAIVDCDAETVERDGLTRPAPRLEKRSAGTPDEHEHEFPVATYEACLTGDQVDAVAALETLRSGPTAVVVEADRGRGKSSAAGLAAGALAAEGERILVTAPEFRAAREAFARARELLSALDALASSEDRSIRARGGGSIRFLPPARAVEAIEDDPPDALVVDEAAALPVRLLERFLSVDRVAFATTIHGYEGAGRGFSVRFRDRLAGSRHAVREVRMDEPIRYAPGDPIEVWAFRALLLDARPPVDELVADATPETVSYRELSPDELLADEALLREAFGLLVLAHYRTEPDDLARLLDAPNLSIRALCHEGHVVCVALLAREGGLDAETRRDLYDGGRIRGNMIPDLLTSQLRDEESGATVGLRVMRIATHHAVRSRGLGSRLLGGVRDEFAAQVDWLGTGYGATPGLLSFWEENGYATVHLSTTRNETSGEYSAIMLDPTSDAGVALHDRHAAWFASRAEGVLSDPLDDADPDVVRAALGSVDTDVDLDLPDRDWRFVASAAYGPGAFDVAPGPFRRVAVKHLVDPDGPDALSDRRERLLVCKVLQGRPWDAVADRLEFVSTRLCMRALGETFKPLVDLYGNEAALAEKRRYDEG